MGNGGCVLLVVEIVGKGVGVKVGEWILGWEGDIWVFMVEDGVDEGS